MAQPILRFSVIWSFVIICSCSALGGGTIKKSWKNVPRHHAISRVSILTVLRSRILWSPNALAIACVSKFEGECVRCFHEWFMGLRCWFSRLAQDVFRPHHISAPREFVYVATRTCSWICRQHLDCFCCGCWLRWTSHSFLFCWSSHSNRLAPMNSVMVRGTR